MRTILKCLRSAFAAFLVGALLALGVPLLLALVAAAPGLAALIRAIKSAEFPLQPVYFTLTTFLPTLLLSFVVGLLVFRALSGNRVWLLAASAAPWVLNAAHMYADICLLSPVSCTGAYDVAGFVVVPLGLLLAALASRPPSLDTSIGTDPQRQEAATPQGWVVRSSSR